ncbi:MAG TPA: S8 family serine peptidase, partial [Chthoniobacteraceae bacterium]|nr:S8 family serine peptidase [Chthoniobacteraceae bacterium]
SVVGTVSGEATAVGSNFASMAPGAAEVLNYEVYNFIDEIYDGEEEDQQTIPAEIINQSWSYTDKNQTDQASYDVPFDNYAAETNTLFVTSAGDDGVVLSPATMYNGIAVAAYNNGGSAGTASGPTYGGRSKPDITAIANETSFSAPEVSAAAAVLLEAAQRGDAGPGTESDASDARVLKALLLNGATKPTGWSNTPTQPLDPNWGAGILNVYNSYENLAAGEYAPTSSCAGSLHSQSSTTVLPNEGWDLASFTNVRPILYYEGQANYYQFDLSSSVASSFTLSSTLIWWLEANQTQINNIYLYLYDSDTGQQIAVSDSTVDNVQQLYVTDLAPGDYDLVVYKAGGLLTTNGGKMASATDTYALAFNFAPNTSSSVSTPALSIQPVPEPSEILLLIAAAGVPVLSGMRRRKS